MAELKARIGPKATRFYPNLSWIRPGAGIQPPKSTVEWTKAHQSHENEYDSDASSHEQPFPQTLSPNKYMFDHQTSPSRPRQHSGPLSLLSRMGLNSGGSEDGTSEGEETASIQQSLLARIEEETPHSSPNIGSTGRDNAHMLDSNGYHDNANSNHAQRLSSQPSFLVWSFHFFYNGRFVYLLPHIEWPVKRLCSKSICRQWMQW